MTLTRDDALMPNLEPGHHAYRIEQGERLRGVVASGTSSQGRRWWAYRIHPSRSRRWVPVAVATTRSEAVRALCEGRP